MAEKEKIPPQKIPQELLKNEVSKADAAKDEEISSTGPVAAFEEQQTIN